MRTTLYIGLVLFSFIQACGYKSNYQDIRTHNKLAEDNHELSKEKEIINPDGQILLTRILPPQGFQRNKSTENSFAFYLRHLPLQPHNSEFKLYNGKRKPNYGIYDAVVDLDIGTNCRFIQHLCRLLEIHGDYIQLCRYSFALRRT